MRTKLAVLSLAVVASLFIYVSTVHAGTTLEMGKYFQVLPPGYEPHDPPNGLYNGPGVAAVGWLNIVTYEESGNPRDQNINHVMERSCCTGWYYGTDQYVTFKFGRVPGDFNLYSVDLETACHLAVGNDLSLSYSFDNVNWTTIGTGGANATITGTVNVGTEDSLYVRTWLYGDYGGTFWTMIADWTGIGYDEIGALKARVSALENDFDNHVHNKGSGGRMTSGPIIP